jgi:DnaJ-class molecular chaperone
MSDDAAQTSAPEPCSACRGTGVVLSNLGGEPHEQPCPWCDGGGVRIPGHDAQAHWRAAAPEH